MFLFKELSRFLIKPDGINNERICKQKLIRLRIAVRVYPFLGQFSLANAILA